MESKQDENASSCNQKKDDSLTTTVKIELERVPDDTPTVSNTDSSQVSQVTGRVRDNDTVTVITNMESTGSEVQENPHETNPNLEVPVTGIRYFKDIGQDVPASSSSSSEKTSISLPKSVSGNVEFVKPVEPYSVTIDHEKTDSTSQSRPIINAAADDTKYGSFELYAEDTGPKIYNVKGNIVSRPIITKNLARAFRAQPVHGKPESKEALDDFYEQKIRDYIGYGISDSEFGKLQKYMDGDYLKTGLECTTAYSFPAQGPLSPDLNSYPPENGPGKNLCIVKKLQLRIKKDTKKHYHRKLKYRGLRMRPLTLGDEDENTESILPDESEEETLEPGQDLIFRARFYRPYNYGSKDQRHLKPSRHSVFNSDLVLLGRQPLTALRDRIPCANDVGARVDVSHHPDGLTDQSAKDMFPSGFLFINNVFYVDRRAGCADQSAVVREWALRRGLGAFPVRAMHTRLDEVVLRCGHPEVYIHQGKCEHLFTFSEVRLVSACDPLRVSLYPRATLISHNQSVYCTTCAEFGAKWIVVGCDRVPFDPAFFCDTCFRFYLYDRDGNKIGDFKAYSYKGNTVNFTKPIFGSPQDNESNGEDSE